MRLYVIRDLVAEESGPIFEAKNDQVARRGFRQALERSRGGAGEFKLMCIAEYDHDKDLLQPFPFPQEVFPMNQEENDE